MPGDILDNKDKHSDLGPVLVGPRDLVSILEAVLAVQGSTPGAVLDLGSILEGPVLVLASVLVLPLHFPLQSQEDPHLQEVHWQEHIRPQ